MNKIFQIATILVALAITLSHAGADNLRCVVLTRESVNVKDATAKKHYADYAGKRYFFCCQGCTIASKQKPAKYAKKAGKPAPKKNVAKP